MLRALYSGISGMQVNQTKLDVIGNNIANVGTTAFKGSRVRFEDMLSQNMAEAVAPGTNQGGTDPKQVGLGVQVAGVDTIVSQGMMQPTSRNLDAAIDGDGYFMVGKGPTPVSNASGVVLNNDHTINNSNGMDVMYTRDGALTLDSQGNLLTSDGYRVLGYPVNGSVNYSYGNLNGVSYVNADDPNIKAGSTLVPLVIPDQVTKPPVSAVAAGNTDVSTTGMSGAGNLVVSVDGKAPITVAINPGDSLNTIISNINTAAGSNVASASGNRLVLTSSTTGANSSINIDPSSSQAALTALGLNQGTSDGADQTDVRVKTFAIEKDGLVKAVLDDGSVSVLGQIAMASFKNPEGLDSLGKDLYAGSANSGTAVVRSGYGSPAASDNSGGYGDMIQGMLEMSNVDLSQQFTDMIVTNRAFEANSKVITTGDQILQDILGIIR